MSRPTLSVLCITRGPGAQVAAVLEPLRVVADEIVVAADDRVTPGDLAHYASVADRVIRYAFALPVERSYAWAHAQCTGDWVLRIDGDEWLSPELIARLPKLIARRDRLQYWIPRRWSHPDPEHWIDERPWAPDVQLRLVRNDEALLSFPGLMHTAAAAIEPYEILEQPFYHLDLLLKSLDERVRKTDAYEMLRPGLSAPGGGPMAMYYLPERWAGSDPVATPPSHVVGLRSVLDGAQQAPSEAAPEPSAVPCATREEIDAYWDAKPMPPDAYAATLSAVESHATLMRDEHGDVMVRVTNDGTARWPGGLDRAPFVRLGHTWLTADGEPLAQPTPRTGFPSSVGPGESVIARLSVVAPPRAGTYWLEVDALEEGVRWFGAALRILVTVKPVADEMASVAVVDEGPALETSSAALASEEVVSVYRELLGREPAPAEIQAQRTGNATRAELVDAVIASPEHQSRQAAAGAGAAALATASFVEGLRVLNDTLAAAGFADRYWIWGGLLIGFAREGWPLAHDSHDADFCVLLSDLPEFEQAAKALFAAGFSPKYRFFNNAGRVTEMSFERAGAKFEFFFLEPTEDGQLEYFDLSDGQSGGEPTEAIARIDAQPLEAVWFVARTWLKHADYDAELTAMYGNWRVPDEQWWFMDDGAIVERRPWTRGSQIAWAGELGDLTPDGFRR